MATAAQIGRGTTIEYGDAATIAGSMSFTTVDEGVSVTLPELETSQVEVSNFDSTGTTREFIAGLDNPGTFSFEANWVKGVYDALVDVLNAPRGWRITTPDGTTIEVDNSFLSSLTGNIPDGEQITMSGTVTVSGAVTVTPSA